MYISRADGFVWVDVPICDEEAITLANSLPGLDTITFAIPGDGVHIVWPLLLGPNPNAPIMVRGNGVPVKIVAVFGGKGFMQLVVREDSGIEKPADLKGKTITVMSFQDTTFYALLGLLASAIASSSCRCSP